MSWLPEAGDSAQRQQARDHTYQFSLQPVLDFDTDTEHHTTTPSTTAQQAPPQTVTSIVASAARPAHTSQEQLGAAENNPNNHSFLSIPPSQQAQDQATVLHSPSASRSGVNSGRGRRPTARGGISKRGVSSSAGTAAGGSSSRPRGALSHTKLCRDRLNGMFERLRRTLPAAPVGVEVKHKAQVLDYAITVLKAMVHRTSELEIELAVSSNRATMEWVNKLVAAAGATFTPVATEVMRVFAKRRGWRLGELWLTRRCNTDSTRIRLEFGAAVVNDGLGATTPTGEAVAAFAELSQSYTFAPGEGVQGRVWTSMRPEWLAGLRESNNFVRNELAQQFGMKTCLAVPVTVTGKIEAVICFYDTRHRPYDSQCVDLALRLTWALGNATGGKRAGTLDTDASKAR